MANTYRGFEVKKVKSDRGVWFAIMKDGKPIADGLADLAASTEYQATKKIDAFFSSFRDRKPSVEFVESQGRLVARA